MALPPLANLVAHWKMNDNAANTTLTESIAGYTSAWSGNTSVDSIAGKINTALYANSLRFGGMVNDYDVFSFTDGAGNDNPFSIALWVKLDTFSGTSKIVTKSSATVFEWTLGINSGATLLYMLMYADSTHYIGRTVPAANVPTGEWAHITMTYSGSNLSGGIKIYINASQKDSADLKSATYGGMVNTAIPVYFARGYGAGTGTILDGAMDDIRIYDIELSQSNIDSIYNGGSGTEDEAPPATGWGGKVYGQSPAKVQGIAVSDIDNINGV